MNSRLVASSLILVAGIAAAQSRSNLSASPIHDSRTQLPALSAPSAGFQSVAPVLLPPGMGCDPLDCAEGQHPLLHMKPLQSRTATVTIPPSALAKNNSVCYTMRSYQYTQDAEAPKPSGQTTCSTAHNSTALIVVQPK